MVFLKRLPIWELFFYRNLLSCTQKSLKYRSKETIFSFTKNVFLRHSTGRRPMDEWLMAVLLETGSKSEVPLVITITTKS